MKLLTILAYLFATVTASAGIVRGPYLQNASTSSMVVMWRTDSVATGVVEYGLTDDYGSQAAGSSGLLHEVGLTGLSPNSHYFYRVTSDGAVRTNQFRTFPSGNEPVSIALLGDSRHHKGSYVRDRNVALANWLATYDPHVILHTGDIVNEAEPLTNQLWQYMFDDYSNLMAKAPMYIAAGNHEYSNGVIAEGYLDNFVFPSNGPDQELIYSFDCGMAHITVANIHNASPADNTNYYCPGSAQFTWVTNDLAETEKLWKIFAVHNPAYSSGKYTPYSPLYGQQSTNIVQFYVPELEEYEVSVFANGHDHLYERSAKSNITYMTLSMLDEYYYKDGENPYSVTTALHGAAIVLITNHEAHVVSAKEVSDSASIVDTFIITNAAAASSQTATLYIIK